MKITITGATGLIGQKLCRVLSSENHKLIIITRNSDKARKILPGDSEFLEWDFKNSNLSANLLEGTDTLIHLAGSNIFGKRWNKEYKKEIYDSRIISTRLILDTIRKLNPRPKSFICSSAVGYYGNSGNKILTEDASCGKDFLSQVCKEWEDETRKAELYGIRYVSMRTGIVLDKEGGALQQMLLPFKLFLGGPIGNGKQWFPWIHIDDLVNTYLFALKEEINGPINAVSPNPVTMDDFAKTLGKILHRPSLFKVPPLVLKIALGESSNSVLASIRAVPSKLSGHNYKFKFEELNAALRDLMK